MKNFIEITLGKQKKRIYYEIEKCMYITYRTRGNIRYLSCAVKNCKCRAKIINSVKFERTNSASHTHTTQEVQFEYEIAYERLKKLVQEDNRPIRDIYYSVVRNISAKSSKKLAWNRIRRHLQRIRHSQMPACPNLETLIYLLETDDIIYERFGRVHDNDFYQGSIDNNFMVFANLELIRELDTEIDLFCDGTFNVTPFHTHQLFVVMAELNEKPRPIVYVLMTGRTQKSYDAVFYHIREAILSFDGKLRIPKTATADFETGMRNSLKFIWPDITLVGCNFHMCQALRRKAMSLQTLSTKISNTNTKHGYILKLFMRLSLLPLDRLNAGYEQLKEYIYSKKSISKDFLTFIKYFEQTWMKRIAPIQWCVSDKNRRTNNHLEGYNKFIKQRMRRNPGPYSFLDSLQDLAYDASISYFNDKEIKKSYPDRSQITAPLLIALNELKNGNITEFLFLKRMSKINEIQE